MNGRYKKDNYYYYHYYYYYYASLFNYDGNNSIYSRSSKRKRCAHGLEFTLFVDVATIIVVLQIIVDELSVTYADDRSRLLVTRMSS